MQIARDFTISHPASPFAPIQAKACKSHRMLRLQKRAEIAFEKRFSGSVFCAIVELNLVYQFHGNLFYVQLSFFAFSLPKHIDRHCIDKTAMPAKRFVLFCRNFWKISTGLRISRNLWQNFDSCVWHLIVFCFAKIEISRSILQENSISSPFVHRLEIICIFKMFRKLKSIERRHKITFPFSYSVNFTPRNDLLNQL